MTNAKAEHERGPWNQDRGTSPLRVLVAGVSTRAAAESAARAGFAVTAVDGYADLDQHAAVRPLSLPGDFAMPFSASAAARACRSLEVDAVAYLSNFENDPAAVEDLARGRVLWGNTPAVLRRVRDPLLLAQTLRERGLPVPVTWVPNGPNDANVPSVPNDWLVKPRRSGGGHAIRRWRGGAVPPGTYLQERIEGTPASLVFVAAGGRAVPLGLSTQLIGAAAFGASGYRYCGSILTMPATARTANDRLLVAGGVAASGVATAAVSAVASAVSSAVTEAFGLVGVNGVDFIARDGQAYPVEVNPRWSASMELVERACGISMFAAHAAACTSGALPDLDVTSRLAATGTAGKAIVFARRNLVARGTDVWLNHPDLRDVPRPGAAIPAGGPICTVFATGADAEACEAALAAQAQRVYALVRTW